MNIQLFIDNQEVELMGNETFTLNKVFDSVDNPMDIIVEYSKSINIPITKRNNIIMGNSYRLDKEIITNNDSNIGLYLDPCKRIPVKIIHNNDILLDGYAKFVSSTRSATDNHYTLNIFGILGDIFYTMRDIVVKDDGNVSSEYVLNDYSLGQDNSYTKFNKDFVYNSWSYDSVDLSHPKDAYISQIYGAAPTYCGLYPNFNSKKVQSTAFNLNLISDELEDKWYNTYLSNNNITSPTDRQEEMARNYVEGLDPDGLVGDGLKDYQMRDYRSYKQRPFIYFNKLMYMFNDKIEELFDYSVKLDDGWFNVNNPYWSRMCYMFDHIQKEDIDIQPSSPLKIIDSQYSDSVIDDDTYITYSTTISNTVEGSTTSSTLITNPFNLALSLKLQNSLKEIYPNISRDYDIELRTNNNIRVTIEYGGNIKYFYSAPRSLQLVNSQPEVWNSDWEMPTASNFIPLTEAPDNMIDGYKNISQKEWFYYLPIPQIEFDNINNSKIMNITVEISSNYKRNPIMASFFSAANEYGAGFPISISNNDVDVAYGLFKTFITPISYKTSWQNINVGLSSFYKKEEPLFDVILQYTKMFGLVWNVDYNNKIITIQRRETLFKDYEVEDWSKKLDKTNPITVQPVLFQSKYIKFGYEDIDGLRYSQYKDEFNSQYGDKILRTKYEFNSENKNMIDGILPLIASNRSFIPYEEMINWDTTSILQSKIDDIVRLECASTNDDRPISSGNWCLRSHNNTVDKSYISDDTVLMIMNDESCYLDYRAIEAGQIPTNSFIGIYDMPVFSPIWKDDVEAFPTYGTYYSCLFNTPKVDYTKDLIFDKANGRTIYDLFWGNYISDRYNTQNKMVVANFNLSISDYNNFKFNKLVILDNQLFLVNRIIDFDPTSTSTTKCELIQIQNINNYNKPLEKFEPIVIGGLEQSSPDWYLADIEDGYGTITFYVRGYPRPKFNISIDFTDVEYDESIPIVKVEDMEQISDYNYAVTLDVTMGDFRITECEIGIDIITGDISKFITIAIYP